MNGGIFLLQDDRTLLEMKEQPYESEALLQALIANYPNLLAGDQMDSASPRRWLLVTREMGVPAEEDGSDRWSLDHLFLDQDAIPTLIEVKRSSDTRIRREVVGQMLDYAANAVVYWPVEAIRAAFQKSCESRGIDSTQELLKLLGENADAEQFWLQVKTNLQAGKIRMVFVADDIPSELRRIVEFLNGQMDPAEVLAIEIRQFVGENLKTLVPRVIGQTTEAERKKSAGGQEGKQWDETSFFQDLLVRRGEKEVDVARAILQWAKDTGLRVWWGKGLKDGSFIPLLDFKEMKHFLISVWTYGRLNIQFEQMTTRPPFDAEVKRQELCRRLNAIPGVQISPESIRLRPSIQLRTLSDSAALGQFLAVLDWAVQEIRAS